MQSLSSSPALEKLFQGEKYLGTHAGELNGGGWWGKYLES